MLSIVIPIHNEEHSILPLYDRLTGYDNLRYCAELFAVPAALIETRIRDAAERFGIADALPVRVGAYSTGIRARLVSR